MIVREMDLITSVAKNDARDITTNLDQEVENLIVSAIQKKFPGHNIMMEEGRDIDNQSDYIWIIDPIDGTKYFVKGVKVFTVCIGLWHQRRPYLGVVYYPGTGDCYFAEKGKGAWLNNESRKLEVSKISRLEQSIISLDVSKTHQLAGRDKKRFLNWIKLVTDNFYRFRVWGMGSLSMCYLAQGFFDAYFDATSYTKIVDLGAGLVIAQEAGAKITDLDGKFPGFDAKHFVVSNGKIHKKLLNLLNQI